MQVRLLGPVDVVADGVPRQVRGLRRKAVLATLALHCGEVVGAGRLVDVVWARDAPPNAISTLQNHMSHLRGALGSRTAIVARPPGYVLDLDGDGTDVRAAERLLEKGTRAADPVQGVRCLREAQGLWRGRSLADVAGVAWLEEQAERLDALLVRVQRTLCDMRLAAGEHGQLVPELERMVAERPLDEQACGQLMVALYRSGRQADALAAYHRLRRTLGEELGTGPGQALRDVETAILRQDRALGAPARMIGVAAPVTVTAPPTGAAPVPAQLPAAVPGFAGRDAELGRLDAILAQMRPGGGPAHQDGPGAVVISAVSGTAGVGKTALAVHWAHRVAGQFPGGQLYVNLRGFDPGGATLDPAEAVRGFLEALGVVAARIPRGLDAQTALYRSLLAGKQVLVVLDNARDAEHVRPLLPSSPGCLAIVTSRNRMAGLAAAEGASPLSLDLLTAGEAHELLARRLGADRVAAEPAAAGDIIERCARLPLALAVAAAHAAIKPGSPLAAVAAELREATSALDPFEGDDLATDVRAVFSWSYRALAPAAARLFRLLGLHPGADTTLAAAASLAAIAPDRARALLAELTQANLLAEHSPGRYAFHDLLRAYAAERAHTVESQYARDAAVSRVLDHCLHTAYAAVLLTDSRPEPIELAPPLTGVTVSPPASADDALAWFAAEHMVLLAAIKLAAQAGRDTCAWQLAWALRPFLLRRGLWEESVAAVQAGLDAARHAGDTLGEAHSLLGLATGTVRSGRYQEGGLLFEQALSLFETMGGHFGTRAAIHTGLILVAHALQRPADMLSHSLQTLAMHRASGNQAQELMALNDVGYTYARLGDYPQALAYCQQALAISQKHGQRNWENIVWHSLGYIHHHTGDYQQAITCYERSADLCRQDAHRHGEAEALTGLGDVYHSTNDLAAARRAWADALGIFDEIGHPDADGVRAKLEAAAQPVTGAVRTRG